MKHAFRARLKGYGRPGTATFIAVPKKVMAAFAPAKRVPVKVTINGFAFRTTITDMGDGPCFGVNAQVREGAGAQRDDMVDIALDRDTQKRTVTIPKDLLAAMSVGECARFKKFSYTHQKEYAEAIDAAKKPETRTRRIAKTLEMIRAKM